MTFKILSLDGGGLRGILSATILKQVEKTIRAEKGQELYEYFDLITGTSTGSILAAGIVCQMSAAQLTDFYLQEGKNIFLDSVRKQRKWRILSQLVGGHLLYPHERGDQGLANVLRKKLIHPQLGSLKMGQIVRPHIVIPAYDVYSRNTSWFANNPEEHQWYDDLELWRICTASASAPTFFPPYALPFNADQKLPHIDGGVAANNPALLAIAHVLLTKKIQGVDLSDIAVLSIGTGNTTRAFSYDEIKKWGILGWGQHLTDMFLNPAAKNSEDIGRQIVENGGKDYLRLNFDLNERLAGDPQPGRLRPLLAQPYNQYIFDKTGERRAVSEEMDNPDQCQNFIEAAEAYLDCGEVYYKHEMVSVLNAIHRFVEAH